MSSEEINPEEMTEEQLHAAYEAEIKRIRVEQVLLENVITLINLGMRRTGLIPGTEDERDPSQVTIAVDSVRALMPTIEKIAPEQVKPIHEALSQLQMAFVQSTGQGGAPAGAPATAPTETAATETAPQDPAAAPGDPGPAQRSGRLWVPGQ